MAALSPLDWVALAFFAAMWLGYVVVMDSRAGRATLNMRMHDYRTEWMQRMLRREPRIVDTQIMASLQNGTAFFASTSLLAVGASLAVLRAADDVIRVVTDLPVGAATIPRMLWEMKVFGLATIFVYAFFKFAWSYRLFNYAAILLGATPPVSEADTPAAQDHVRRLAAMATAAGRHFNRGQRAFFFALGYLGWFISPLVFMGSTAAVVVVMVLRQFRSDAHDAVSEPGGPG